MNFMPFKSSSSLILLKTLILNYERLNLNFIIDYFFYVKERYTIKQMEMLDKGLSFIL